MFLFLALLPCVAAQCHEPHLQKRDWHDGDRHCSYRESVVFDSFSREFDRLVGPEPKATALITGEAMALSAHEGAVFLEHGAGGEAAASLLFTTKPYETEGRRLAAVKRLVVDGPTAGTIDTLFESENLVNGATLGRDGRLYFCFQGGLASGKYLPSGIYSVDPWRPTDIRTVTDAWMDGTDGGDPLYYNSPNDVVVDRKGNVWFTDPAYAYYQGLVPNRTLGDWVWRWDARPP